MVSFVFREGSLTLNDEQAAIVRQPPTQNLRILASAGSGKTTTLTARIAHLLTDPDAGARPEEIVLLTFTHNAAAVMRERLEALMGPLRILCGTFHALSQQILRTHNPEALNDVYHVDELPLKALDFLATDAGRTWARTLRWLFIDEFQDINDTQYEFIRALHHPAATVTIVGDDAQNIYTWRGSCVDYILNFHKRFSGVADFQLSTNYRSTSAIIAVANSIMRYIPTLPHKELMSAAPHADTGERPAVHYFSRTSEERDWVTDTIIRLLATPRSSHTIAILSKFNSVLYSYEAALKTAGIRVRFVDNESKSGSDSGSGSGSGSSTDTVYLSTFHGSKGLEWDHVFLVRMNDEVFPQQKDEDSVLQERRLFYVAVTRARRTLTFTYSRQEKSLSRFVREIHRPLLSWPGLPQYELSTLSSTHQTSTVREWIGYLTGEDFRTIKRLGVLPAILRDPTAFLAPPPSPTFAAPEWTTPYWWTEQGMSAEFYDFLRAFWFREIGCARPESGGQWDPDAHRIIWTVKIAAEDAAVFERHRDLFGRMADQFFGSTERGGVPPTIHYMEVLTAIGPLADTLTQAEIIRIIQIFHKMRTMLYNLRFAHVTLSELRFAPIRHTPPQETRCPLIAAWRLYTNGRPLTEPQPTAEELGAVYQVGLCRALADGRNGVLAALPGEKEWARCRDFLTVFRGRAAALLAESASLPILCRVQADVVEGVSAMADMLVGDTAWFLVADELNRLDRVIAILLTVHALRSAGHVVQRVCLYHLLTGTRLEWSVADWRPASASLLAAFIQARVQHATEERG